MAVRTYGEPIAEFSGESVTTGTAIVSVGIPPGAVEVIAYGAAAHRVQIGAKIAACLKTTDSGATFTNYTTQVQDRDTTTIADLSSLSTAANGDYWYLGSNHKFAGCTIDMLAANGTGSVMTGYYWNGTSWVDVTITDNTDLGGACLGEDQTVTFPVPSAWAKTTTTDGSGLNNYPGLYVIRFQVSVALDSTTTISEISLLPDTTAAPAGYMATTTDYIFSLNTVESGSLAFYAGAGSTVSLTWVRHSKRGNT